MDALEVADALRQEHGYGENWTVDTDEYNCITMSFGEWSVHLEVQDDVDAIINALRSVVKEILRNMGL